MSGYCDVAPGHPVPRPVSRSRVRLPARAATPSCSSGWRSRSIRPGCHGSRSSRSARRFTQRVRRLRARDASPASARATARGSSATPAIIRNRLKVDAVIDNAKRVLELRKQHGSFAELARRAPSAHQGRVGEAVQADVPLHRRRDRGRVPDRAPATCPGAHQERCPVYKKVARLKPPWMRVAGRVHASSAPPRAASPRAVSPCRASARFHGANLDGHHRLERRTLLRSRLERFGSHRVAVLAHDLDVGPKPASRIIARYSSRSDAPATQPT